MFEYIPGVDQDILQDAILNIQDQEWVLLLNEECLDLPLVSPWAKAT